MLLATDPRPALYQTRTRLIDNIARQRRALAQLGCGCGHGTCLDEASRTQLLTLITANVRRLDTLNDQISQRP